MADTATLQANLDVALAKFEQAFDDAQAAYPAVTSALTALDAAKASGDAGDIAAAQATYDYANEKYQSLVDAKRNARSEVEAAQAAINAAGGEENPTHGVPEDQTDGGQDESVKQGNSTGSTDDTSASTRTSSSGGRGNEANVPFGAKNSVPAAAEAKWSEAKDLRAKLRVPNEYLKGPASGPSDIIKKNGGILFPYTPQISLENQANYSNQNPLHSNFPLYFYKNSTVGPINVTAKFTVQNEFEGAVLLGVIHLLRSLTKMKWGNDPDAGSPPPVCRFDAFGDYMLYNIPVSIASWRHELPEGVDYIAVGRPGSPGLYGHSMVPTISTINLTLNVMYSRREMLRYNVKDWLSKGLDYRGYL